MKLYASIFLVSAFILAQICYKVTAAPVISEKEGNSLEKRKIYPFIHLNSFFYFKKPSDWGNDIYAYEYSEKEELTHWPGQKMSYHVDGDFYYTFIQNKDLIRRGNVKVIFNDRNGHQIPGAMQEGFPLRMDAVYDVNGILGITNEKPLPMYYHGVDKLVYSNIARIYYRPKENVFDETIYIHYKIGNGEWNSIPGEEMAGMKGGFYHIDIDLQDAEDITFTFTDGKTWDNNNGEDYKVNKFGNFLIDLEYQNKIQTINNY